MPAVEPSVPPAPQDAPTGDVPALPEGDDPADDAARPAGEGLPDDAPLSPAVADLADVAPDLVPEVAEQPTPGPGGRTRPAARRRLGARPRPGPSVPADPEQLETAPVDVAEQPEPQEAPEPVVVEAPPAAAAPRRRRRATSRPAGPPTA